jgi:uncharacterized protein (TIGR02145 family)
MPGVLQQVLNNSNNLSLIKYGRLYLWATTQLTLIEGFTVPTDQEYTDLTTHIYNTYNVSPNDFGLANHLKHQRKDGNPCVSGYNTSVHPRWDYHEFMYGRNTVLFSALPGGYRNLQNAFSGIGRFYYLWTSTESQTNAWIRSIPHYDTSIGRSSFSKQYGFSVRCIRAATIAEQTLDDGTLCKQVADYDGNIYDTVKIGGKVCTIQNFAGSKDTSGNALTYYDYGNDASNSFFDTAQNSIWIW